MHGAGGCGKKQFAALGNNGQTTQSIREQGKVVLWANEYGYSLENQHWG